MNRKEGDQFKNPLQVLQLFTGSVLVNYGSYYL